jgi:hypothetical protein
VTKYNFKGFILQRLKSKLCNAFEQAGISNALRISGRPYIVQYKISPDANALFDMEVSRADEFTFQAPL